jgi:REP element-mobilizing transposase RayT
MPYLNIWIHLVWATKNREPLLKTIDLRKQLFNHIHENGFDKNIHIDFVNGYIEHAHALLSLQADQTISKIAQLIKGESSHWINKNNLLPGQFEWQDDYFAVSVSESRVNAVRDYIKNQEQHHQKITFQQEYDEFMEKYGFGIIGPKKETTILSPEEPGMKEIAARL